MIKELREKRSLVRMATALGQTPDPSLLEDIQRLEKLEARLKTNIAADLNEIFSQPILNTARVDQVVETIALVEEPDVIADIPVLENEETWAQRVIDETSAATVAEQVAASIKRQVKEGTIVRPDAQMPAENAALEQKIRYLENWVSRIAATGPGGGAGDVVNLDYPVKTITVSSYTVLRKDHYLGINVDTSTTIVLPTTGTKQGRNLIIKDESGQCSVNRITLTGTVDADTSGAILAIDNGALHLIYNNGWRIV